MAFLIAAFYAYSPALRGPFLFDDLGLPFYVPEIKELPLVSWFTGVRPVLMLSYWLDYALWGKDTMPYHLTNVLLHACNAGLVWVIVRRILELAGAAVAVRQTLALAVAAVFLLHPLQTEAVAYIAGRSEVLSACFALAALAIFLHQPAVISKRACAGILLLLAFAIASKEQAVVLPAVFVAVDVLLRRMSIAEMIRSRMRLYVPLALAGAAGAVVVWRVLMTSTSAGFHLPGITWVEYFFTQCRVWLLYARLFLLPAWQNADYDLPASRTIFEHGAWIGLVVVAGTCILGWKARRRYPLAVFGFALWLILPLPTSSIVPIKDLAAERRMYLPMIGLLLVAAESLMRVRLRWPAFAAAGVLLACAGAATYDRARVWSSSVSLWSDIVAKSPRKLRGYTHLTIGYLSERGCPQALERLSRLPADLKPDSDLLTIWSQAYECAGRPAEALSKLEEAVALNPSAGLYASLAGAYERAGRHSEAEAAAQRALELEPKTPYDRAEVKRLRSRM